MAVQAVVQGVPGYMVVQTVVQGVPGYMAVQTVVQGVPEYMADGSTSSRTRCPRIHDSAY